MKSNSQRSGDPVRLSVPRRRPRAATIAVLAVGAWWMVGCGGGDSPSRDSQLTVDLAKQLEDERLRGERANTRHQTELAEVESDFRGAVLAWASTAAAAAILIMLLARERGARRVLERVLRLVLDRLRDRQRESRGPPSS